PNITRALPPGSKLTIVDPATTGQYWSSQRPGVGTAPADPKTPTKTSPTTVAPAVHAVADLLSIIFGPYLFPEAEENYKKRLQEL
ncbi:hypothetical protein, partial [Salmonella sp. SAL4445]|uniref:hypothetical protein n=1 Tax=Salmonella sp. SAL4445 TaxID=3159900 RepID=UPI00397977A5